MYHERSSRQNADGTFSGSRQQEPNDVYNDASEGNLFDSFFEGDFDDFSNRFDQRDNLMSPISYSQQPVSC